MSTPPLPPRTTGASGGPARTTSRTSSRARRTLMSRSDSEEARLIAAWWGLTPEERERFRAEVMTGDPLALAVTQTLTCCRWHLGDKTPEEVDAVEMPARDVYPLPGSSWPAPVPATLLDMHERCEEQQTWVVSFPARGPEEP